MAEQNPEEPIPSESSQTFSSSSPEPLLNSAEPTLSEVTNGDASTNPQQTTSASFETRTEQDLPTSLPPTHCDPGTSSSEIDSSMAHPKDVPDGSLSPDEDIESVIHPDESATPSSLSEECKSIAPLHKRQMSLGDIRQKESVSILRSNSGSCSVSDTNLVDTATHIESVRAAATRFGGSIDWKARRMQPMQGAGHVVLELDRLKREILECKRQAEAAEGSKVSVLDELESTKRLIEELKHDLERAQSQETHAQEDAEFAQLMVKEAEEGDPIGDSIAVEEHLRVVRERHERVATELTSVNDELRKLREDFDSLKIGRDISMRKAEAALAMSKETEAQVEELTAELNKAKGLLELAHSARRDAEDHRTGMSLARDEDCLTWEKDLRQAEEELKQLDKKILSLKHMKPELETSSSLLLELNTELAAYMEAKLNHEAKHKPIQEDDVSRNHELRELKQHIDKAKGEVGLLEATASSLKVELDKERASLAAMQQMEGMASIAVSAIEAEISRTQQELEAVRAKEKESREKMVELPKMLQQAAREAGEAKSIAVTAQEELRKAKEEAEQVKASLSTTEFRLRAVTKEIEAARASERVAFDTARALEESELAIDIEQQASPRMITLQMDEYAALSEKARDAEQLADERTAAATAQVEAAKNSEMKTLSRLSDTYKEVRGRKRALLIASERANKATEGKLAMEQQLRKWRSENGQRRKAGDAANPGTKPPSNTIAIVERNAETKNMNREDAYAMVHPLSDMSASSPEDSALDAKAKKKAKKHSFFPRIMMFLARRRLKALK